MPSSTKSLIKALQYILDNEPVSEINSLSCLSIAPPYIFKKLYPIYISGNDATGFGEELSLIDVTITCTGLEYLESLQSKTAIAKSMNIIEKILFLILGVIATITLQLVVNHVIKP